MVLVVDHASGLKFKVGDAHSILYEQDFLRAFVVDVEGTVFVPGWWGLSGLLIFQQFDGYVGEGLVGEVASYVGEVSGRKMNFPGLQF